MSIYEVKKYITNLDANKSTKSDCPTIKLIKQSVDIITPTITKVFNKCISEGVFPETLKKAEITPIFKKGSRLSPGNYRPISLLSPFSKIFERHILNQLNNFINNVLYLVYRKTNQRPVKQFTK